MRLRVALLQMTSHGFDQDANIAKGEEFCRRAAAMGADVALFPEMWNVGYTFYDPARPDARKGWETQAVAAQDKFVQHFLSLARELKMAIALTYLEQWPGPPRDSVSLIDRRGQIRFTYAKVHTCDFDKEAACTPGEDFLVAPLETEQGEVILGAMICFDREFPESARILMLKGAEVILVPNACEMESNRLCQLRARAFENMVGIALTNYAAPQANGHSVAFDPIAFENDETSRDSLVVEAGSAEGVFIADFDMERIRSFRERESWGTAYRKPRSYSLLTSEEVRPPFVRPDSRR